MINSYLLNTLESNFQDPSYSVVISKFEQPEFCNKNQLKIYVEQFTPNLEYIIENNQQNIKRLKQILQDNNISIPDDLNISNINSCIQKTLIIDSSLGYNKSDQMYISELNGVMGKDIDKKTIDRNVKGKIENKRIIITKADNPNYLNKSKFKIINNKLDISIPSQIDTLDVKIIKEDKSMPTEVFEEIYSYLSSENDENKMSIPLNLATYQYYFDIFYTIKESLILQNIESITTPLKYNIDIKFSCVYKNLPAIILTIDEEKKVYSSYSTKFTKNEDNEYIGVSIQFKGLKKQKQYGDINITVIGASKTEDDIND